MLGFKGILLEQMFTLPAALDGAQLSLYDRNEWSYWKVLWFQHPFEQVPRVEGVMEREIIKTQKKNKDNGH
jgi:hypothetical protein